MAKTALVLSGGGSRGSYQIGVWQALRELAVEPDIVTGTSVGALNGAMIVQGDFEIARDMWKSLETHMVFDVVNPACDTPEEKIAAVLESFAREFVRQGGAGTTALEGILREYIDEERVRGSDKEFGIVTVELPALKTRQLLLKDIPTGALHDYLLASAACFPAVQPHEIGKVKYIDGGFADNLPVKLALACDAEEFIVVDLEAVGKVDRKILNGLSNLRLIRSRWELGNFLLFDTSVAEQDIQLGYLDTMKSYGMYDGFAYSFEKGSMAARVEEHLRRLFDMTDRLGITGTEQNSPRRLLLIRLLRTLRQYVGLTDPPPADLLTAAAEITARIWSLSPLTVYTAEQFANALLISKSDPSEQQQRVATLMQRLLQAYNENHGYPLLELITVSAEELIAALYLAFLTLQQENNGTK